MNTPSLLSVFSKKSYAIIFDIGNEFVSALFVRYTKHESTEVIFSHKAKIHYSTKTNAKNLAFSVNDAVQKAGRDVLDTLGARDDLPNNTYTIHAIVHAPWAISQSQHIEKNFSKDTIVTSTLLQSLSEQSEKTIPADKKHFEFDRHITEVTLNGYTTMRPYKKYTKDITITVLTSTMATVIHTSILDAFWQIFSDKIVHIDAFLYVILESKEFLQNTNAFTLIDIGGYNTSITTVRGKTIIASTWAAFGTQSLLNPLLHGTAENQAVARSELTMYLESTGTTTQYSKTEQLLQPVEKEWTQVFGDACSELSKLHKMPTKTFVTVKKKYSPWFEKMVEKFDFGQFTVTGNPLQAEPLTTGPQGETVYFDTDVAASTLFSLEVLFIKKHRK